MNVDNSPAATLQPPSTPSTREQVRRRRIDTLEQRLAATALRLSELEDRVKRVEQPTGGATLALRVSKLEDRLTKVEQPSDPPIADVHTLAQAAELASASAQGLAEGLDSRLLRVERLLETHVDGHVPGPGALLDLQTRIDAVATTLEQMTQGGRRWQPRGRAPLATFVYRKRLRLSVRLRQLARRVEPPR